MNQDSDATGSKSQQATADNARASTFPPLETLYVQTDTGMNVGATETLGFQNSIFSQSNNPKVLMFHFLFRTLAIIIYLFCGWFTSSYVLIFVILVLLLSFDFWTVKNVSGRILVGLRWWNQIRPDGSSSWMFESKRDSTSSINPTDYRLFWWSLYGYAAFWLLLSFFALIQLSIKWLIVTILASILNMANVIGYTRCDKDAKRRIIGSMSDSVVGELLKSQWQSMWPESNQEALQQSSSNTNTKLPPGAV